MYSLDDVELDRVSSACLNLLDLPDEAAPTTDRSIQNLSVMLAVANIVRRNILPSALLDDLPEPACTGLEIVHGHTLLGERDRLFRWVTTHEKLWSGALGPDLCEFVTASNRVHRDTLSRRISSLQRRGELPGQANYTPDPQGELAVLAREPGATRRQHLVVLPGGNASPPVSHVRWQFHGLVTLLREPSPEDRA